LFMELQSSCFFEKKKALLKLKKVIFFRKT